MNIIDIIVIVWIVLAVPFMAFFKALFEKLYIDTIDDSHILVGIFWPITLGFMTIIQLLYALASGAIYIYSWVYKFCTKFL